MKTAIASQSSTTESQIDKHFGKCSCFIIYDNISRTYEVIDNPAKKTPGCKGDVIVNELLEKNVKQVIAGDFGTIVQQLLNGHNIQMVIYPDTQIRVSEIFKLISQKDK